MEKHVCPWWIGSLLASPVRKLFEDPVKILSPYIKEGMTVLDAGPGMGFFSIPAAELTGPSGRVIAVDLQDKMLKGLMKRAKKKGLDDRIETRLCSQTSLSINDLIGQVDLAMAFNVIHEVPDERSFFEELYRVLRKGAVLIMTEPKGHVSKQKYRETIAAAELCGFQADKNAGNKKSWLAVLRK